MRFPQRPAGADSSSRQRHLPWPSDITIHDQNDTGSCAGRFSGRGTETAGRSIHRESMLQPRLAVVQRRGFQLALRGGNLGAVKNAVELRAVISNQQQMTPALSASTTAVQTLC